MQQIIIPSNLVEKGFVLNILPISDYGKDEVFDLVFFIEDHDEYYLIVEAFEKGKVFPKKKYDFFASGGFTNRKDVLYVNGQIFNLSPREIAESFMSLLPYKYFKIKFINKK